MKFPDGKQRLVLRGDTAPFEANIVRALGFTKTRAGFFVRESLRATLSSFKEVFPQATISEMVRKKVVRIVSDKEDPARVSEELALRQAKPLGTNYLGQEVYVGVMGRFVRSSGDGAMIQEGQAESPAVFLRARDKRSLQQCAEGFVLRMMSGRVFKRGDLEQFTRVIYDVERLSGQQDHVANVNAAVELAMAKRWLSEIAAPDRHAFGVAVRLHEAQPMREAAVRREGVPLPLVAAISAIASASGAMRVGVLQSGIGVGAAAIVAPQVIANDSDPAYKGAEDRVDLSRVVWDKVAPESVDVSVSLAPTRAIPGNTYSGVFLNRTDHVAALHALAARKPNGRSIILLGGDNPNSSWAGQVGASQEFLKWVYTNYHVEALVEIEGGLTRKQQSGWPYRLLVVGDRLPEPAAEPSVPFMIQVLSSFDELWDFSKGLFLEQAVEAAPVVEAATAQPITAAEDEVVVTPAVVTPAPVGAAANDVVNLSAENKATEENAYQAPYVPFSRVGRAEAMIPRNLVAPTNRALSRVAQERGNIDEFVASSLGFGDPQAMENLYSPEQIDALALAIHAVERGKGFVEGDMTGLGKGRVLAGMARWAVEHGKPVVFITEKPNLFSDFWRDLTDTQLVDRCQPFLVNTGVSIINAKGERVMRSQSKAVQDELFLTGSSPWDRGYNIVFATYSQFSRPAEASAKSAWLPKACEGALMILDESHNAAGDSQVNKNIEAAMEKADGVVFSSATFAKTAANMTVYRRVFPSGLQHDELKETLEMGGEPLNEVLSASLAEDGVLVRREHDMSQLEFDTLIDTERMTRNEQLADEIAELLVGMAQASREAENLMMQAAMRDPRASYTIPNFGSRRYLLSRQLMLALKIDQASDLAIKALENGEKPVLVVESTMESLIREALLEQEMSDDQLLSGDVSVEAPDKDEAVDERAIRAVTFRDVLAKIFDRSITVRRKFEDTVERIHASELKLPLGNREKIQKLRAQVMAQIQKFPELPASPLDAFRENIEAAGYSCGEISGRGVRLASAGEGKQKVVSAGGANRAETVRAYNAGELDVVLLTRSGSTGISLHNSSLFADQRPRVMIEAQIFNNVAERVQVYGRCNRKGQVSAPKILTLSTGLPGEVRNLAMQKKKLRALSANTTSNRESQVDTDGVVDVLNPLGEMVARGYLEANPQVASRLGIDPQRTMEDASDIYVVNALMARIEMLTVAEQRLVIVDVTSEYTTRLAELDAQGMNPFKMAEHDWRAKVVSETVFEPAQSGHSVLDAEVVLKEIEYEKVQNPMRSARMRQFCDQSLTALGGDLRVQAIVPDGRAPRWAEVAKAMVLGAYENVRSQQAELVQLGRFNSLEEALSARESNQIQTLQKRYISIRDTLGTVITLGNMVLFEHAGEPVRGVVVGLVPPVPGKEHLAGQYEVKIAVPGEALVKPYSLNTLIAGGVKAVRGLTDAAVDRLFDAAPSGVVKDRRLVLDGNLFRSSQYAVRHDIGHAISYVDDKGAKHLAVLVKRGVTKEEVLALPVRLGSQALVAHWLRSAGKAKVSSSPEMDAAIDSALRLERLSEGRYLVEFQKNSNYGWLRKDKVFLESVGRLQGRTQLRAAFDESKLAGVLSRLSEVGVRFYAPAEARPVLQRALNKKAPKPVAETLPA